jgi:hypothetical protein
VYSVEIFLRGLFSAVFGPRLSVFSQHSQHVSVFFESVFHSYVFACILNVYPHRSSIVQAVPSFRPIFSEVFFTGKLCKLLLLSCFFCMFCIVDRLIFSDVATYVGRNFELSYDILECVCARMSVDPLQISRAHLGARIHRGAQCYLQGCKRREIASRGRA